MKTKILLVVLSLVLLTAAGAGAAEKPSMGVCLMFSPNILGDRDNQASLTIKDAVFSKFGADKYELATQVTPADFKNHLGKQEILVNDIPQMINTIKLPVFVAYGEEKQLDYLTVVFCQAVADKTTASTVQAQNNKSGSTSTTTYNTISTTYFKKVDLLTRVVVVDVKKQQYIYNLLLNKTVNDDNGFRTEVRAIRAVAKEYVKDFAAQITPPEPQ